MRGRRVPVEEAERGVAVAIRRARVPDAPMLTALMHASSACAGAWAAILDGYAVTARQVSRDAMFVAEAGATLLGFHSIRSADDGSELDLLFVADAAHGRGVGALLLRHACGTARDLGIPALRIVSHPPAEGFYQRMGAKRIGTAAPAGRVGWPRPILELDVTRHDGQAESR